MSTDPATAAFSITGSKPGAYRTALRDEPIHAIADYRTVTIPPGGAVALGPVSVHAWFETPFRSSRQETPHANSRS